MAPFVVASTPGRRGVPPVEFRVLGGLEVVGSDGPIELRGAKRRALVGLLLAEQGRAVPADRVVRHLWDDDRQALARVKSAVHELRKLFGVDGGRLVTGPGGYSLRVAAGEVDAAMFETLLSEATTTVDREQAAALLSRAASLWRGGAFEEFADTEWAAGEAGRLDMLRLRALEELVDAELDIGRHLQAVDRLESLVVEHPLRERFWGQLMVALYRCGRQGDALRAFKRVRGVLADELGIGPSPELIELERRILDQDPTLAWTPRPLDGTAFEVRNADRAVRADRPVGTVTFLFSDVEGSTRLWEESPEAMRSALRAHHGILRAAMEGHGGHVFSTAGDAFSAAFWTPADALAAAVEAQRQLSAAQWPERAEVRVQMGIETGPAEEREGHYVGPAVNRAARLMAAAHGDQIVVSQAVEALMRDRAPEGVTFVDLGEHELAGPARRERLFQVSGPGLVVGFPLMDTAARLAGNVPLAVTSFVGRGEELWRLAADVPLRRLITLTGVGGVGKTRLALEAARMVADKFPDGVWLCELAPVAEPAAVAHAVATILSIRTQAGLSLVDSVVDALRGRRLLVILDNCEHLLDAAAELVGRVTESCPTVTVLATSREPLGVAGERVWSVPSLAATEGAQLFCDRAEAAHASFSPSEGDLVVIAEICERLDGIPLAIELAAARVRSMTVVDVAERLDDRFRLLRGGRRGLERHQTLAATVQWSYRLLPESERVLFDRLSVFAGGFTLRAAEAVCADDGVDRLDIAGDLAALVDKSMVVADRAGNHARYRLLETLRQFGEERLDETVHAGELRDRHLRHYVGVAHEARRHYEGRAHAAGAATLRSEWANIRAAIHRAITQDDRATATGILDDLYLFAYLEERYELGEWASHALRKGLATPITYGIAGAFAAMRGDYDHALRLLEAGFAAARSRTEPDTWVCWWNVGGAHWYLGHREEARAAWTTLRQIIDPAREPFRATVIFAFSTVMAATGGEPDSAPELLAHVQRLAAPLDNPALDAVVAYASGGAARAEGQYEAARQHYIRALALGERSGNLLMLGIVPMSQAFMAVLADAPDAERSLLDAIGRLYESRDWQDTWPCVEALALYWMRIGHLDDATVLLGHLDAQGIGHAMWIEQRRHAREALAETPDAHRLMSRGARLDRDELLQRVLATHASKAE
jgi:predicted ATPase/DNA-binding SARP family transcriptional activator